MVKRRPARITSFYGRVEEPGRVHWGVLVKRMSPERAGALLERHRAVSCALATGTEFPRAPHVLAAEPREGWIAFEIWPGRALSLEEDPTMRSAAVSRVARRLAALERIPGSRWTGRSWSGERESERLDEVWSGSAGRDAEVSPSSTSPPGWTDPLRDWLARQEARVAAHRDLYAEQVIMSDADDSCDRWIDWDEAALAPAGLDLGNLLAHERLAAAEGIVAAGVDPEAARETYRAEGGLASPAALSTWEAVACLRLAGLILQRSRGIDRVERSRAFTRVPSASETVASRLVVEARTLWESVTKDIGS